MTTKKMGLGKGLGALLSAYDDYDDTVKNTSSSATNEIVLSSLVPNPNQPRKNFDQTALQE